MNRLPTKYQRRPTGRPPSFTLIELLVVVAIIAILAALLLPALGSAKENSRRSVCAGMLKQVGMLCHLYADDYSGWFPPAAQGGNSLRNLSLGGTCKLITGLGWLAHSPVELPVDSPNYTTALGIFYCPNLLGMKSGSYNLNPTTNWIQGRAGYLYYGDPQDSDNNVSCSYTGLMRSAQTSWSSPSGFAYGPDRLEKVGFGASRVLLAFDIIEILPPTIIVPHPRSSDPDGGNAVFADNHVEWINWFNWATAGGINNYYRPRYGY